MQNKNGGYENDCSLARIAVNQWVCLLSGTVIVTLHVDRSHHSSVSIVPVLWTGRFMAQEINFSPFQNVQVALEVHPPYCLVGRGIFSSLGVKQLGHEADCLPVSSVQGKNDWNYTSALHVYLHVVHRAFTFTFEMLIIWIFVIGCHDLPFCFYCTITRTVWSHWTFFCTLWHFGVPYQFWLQLWQFVCCNSCSSFHWGRALQIMGVRSPWCLEFCKYNL